jgi:hypothetical protein
MLEGTPSKNGIEIHGPFVSEYRVTIDGYDVPYINARPLDDGRLYVTVDGRFGMDMPVSREEFDRWVHILANAMAVAAGYSAHGENCSPLNPYKVKVSSLGTIPPEFAVIDGGLS